MAYASSLSSLWPGGKLCYSCHVQKNYVSREHHLSSAGRIYAQSCVGCLLNLACSMQSDISPRSTHVNGRRVSPDAVSQQQPGKIERTSQVCSMQLENVPVPELQ